MKNIFHKLYKAALLIAWKLVLFGIYILTKASEILLAGINKMLEQTLKIDNK